MANIFDRLQTGLWETVNKTFGYDATWQPSQGGALQSAKVLYKDPSQNEKLQGIEYNPYHWQIEYNLGSFDGLMEAVRAGETETISLLSKTFYVREVTAHWDGKTYIANLELIP